MSESYPIENHSIHRNLSPLSPGSVLGQRFVMPTYLAFFLSGLAGLMYEVLWSDKLALMFGHTTLATTTVLVAFMAGLGLGSWLFGRWANRCARPIWVFGWMELGLASISIGVYCLIGPSRLLYASIHTIEPGLQWGHYAARVLISLGLLLLPTVLMGGMLPVLSRALTWNDEQIAIRPGMLYAINTLGALCGCVLAGFVLLPMFGQRAVLLVAIGVNIFVGCFALIIGRHCRTPVIDNQATSTEIGRSKNWWRDKSALALLSTSFVTGLCLFSYETVWSRLVALMVGGTAFSFSTMLATVLFGIGIGSLLVTLCQSRREPTMGWLVLIQFLAAVMIVPLFWAIESWPLIAVIAAPVVQDSSYGMLMVGIAFCVLFMLPTSIVLGMCFPLTIRLFTRKVETLSRGVGLLYAANTLGGVGGCALAGLVLLPMFGLQATLLLTSIVLLGSAAILTATLWTAPPPYRMIGTIGLTLLAIQLSNIPAWNPLLIHSGPLIYARDRAAFLPGGLKAVKDKITSRQVLLAGDGISSSVAVLELNDGNRLVRVNGKTDGSTSDDMETQLLSAYLPLFARPQAQHALVIGFGTGVTAGALTKSKCRTIDCIEVEPRVLDGYPHFRHVNHSCLEDPRVRVFINDARNHMELSRQKYDLIISEPSNPWIAGVANLFTTEHYQTCRKRLRPQGIVAQWLQLYSLGWDSYHTVLATFADQFPYVHIFQMNGCDTLLLGSSHPIEFDPTLITHLIDERPEIALDLERYSGGTNPIYLLRRTHVLSSGDVRALVHGYTRRNTDEHLRLQYSAAWALGRFTLRDNTVKLQAARRTLDLPLTRLPTMNQLMDPDHLVALLREGSRCRRSDRADLAERLARMYVELDEEESRAHFLLAKSLEQQGRAIEAEVHFHRAGQLDPLANFERGKQFIKRHKYAEAARVLEKAVQTMPFSAKVHQYLSSAYSGLERKDDARYELLRAMELDPTFTPRANKTSPSEHDVHLSKSIH